MFSVYTEQPTPILEKQNIKVRPMTWQVFYFIYCIFFLGFKFFVLFTVAKRGKEGIIEEVIYDYLTNDKD